MPDTDESAYRRRYRATGEEVEVREGDELDTEDGVFEIRMPIASTGEVRNDDDEPLTRDELNGMARQLGDRQIGVFPAHGGSDMIAGGRYSPFERLGDWTDAAIESREDENVLLATARMPDPETLPAATGDYREALAIVKEQAQRGIAQDASIGWRDDESFPGGVDLMEASIVGIGADWRTNTADEGAAVVTQAALDAGANRSELLANVRAAIRGGRPLGPEEDPQRFDDWDDCMSAMQESGHSESEAERICGSFKEESEKQAATHNLDDPEFGEGDAVSWPFQGDTVHGRVADIGEEFTVAGNTITGDDGEAVYLIHEYDEDVEAFREANVAKPQSSLSESQRDLPPATEENMQSMTNEDSGDNPGTTDEQSAGDGETRMPDDLTEERLATFTAVHYDGFDESDVMDAADAADAEFVGTADVEELYDLVSVVVGAEYDAVESAMEDLAGGENEMGEDDEEEGDDEDEEQSADDPDSEQAAGDEDPDLRSEVEALREELDDLRSGGVSPDDVETPDADAEDEQDATDEDGETTDDDRDAEDPIEGLGDFR
jgi:hypothetical protein